MTSGPRQGRPRASSRETLTEAACELFLEQGYDNTSVADITARAGVSRSSFFNYFSSKHDLLWWGIDARIAALAEASEADDSVTVSDWLLRFADDVQPDALALAYANAEAMGASEDLARESGQRVREISLIVETTLRRRGFSSLRAEVLAGAYATAVLAALRYWASEGPGRTSLRDRLAEALQYVNPGT